MIARLGLDEAVDALADGAVLAIPTDTVYGVAASFSSPTAIATLFALKHRPTSVALPVLVDSLDQIRGLGIDWDGAAQRLADALWPGALTIIVAAPGELASRIGSDRGSIGFRIPAHDLTRRLLARSGPLAVTSANIHGDEPCHTLDEIDRTFSDSSALAGVLPDGTCIGTVSTVVDLSSGAWRVVREGAVSYAGIAAVLEGPSH